MDLLLVFIVADDADDSGSDDCEVVEGDGDESGDEDDEDDDEDDDDEDEEGSDMEADNDDDIQDIEEPLYSLNDDSGLYVHLEDVLPSGEREFYIFRHYIF